MNVIEILGDRARTRPAKPALIDARTGAISFAELEAISARAAGFLWSKNLRPGDSALVFHPMSAELYIMLLALFRLGVTAIFIDPGAGTRHIERCCSEYPPRAFIGSTRAQLLRAVSPALRRVPLKFVVGTPVPGATRFHFHDASSRELEPCSADRPALITFTSGSTGRPKTIVRSHGFLVAQHRALSRTLCYAPDDRVLSCLPMFVLSHLASGIASVLPDADLRRPEMADAGALVRQLRVSGVTAMELPPVLLQKIVEFCLQKGLELAGIRHVYVGGAPVFPPQTEAAQRVMPNAEIVCVYGSSEAEPIAHVARSEITANDPHRMFSGRGILSGRPIPEINLRILNDRWGEPVGAYSAAEFDAASLGPGATGEIVVSGDHVLPGYLNGEGDRETKFRVGDTVWHRTGDAGYLDGEGRLWLLGRCAARVCDEHGLIYPLSVECAISDFSCVRRAALLQRNGQRILAIEPHSRISTHDVALLKARLAWAGISEIRAVRRIPVDRRHNSKIDYTALAGLMEVGSSTHEVNCGSFHFTR